MFKIAICDDDIEERERGAALVEEYIRERPSLTASLTRFENGRALLDAADQGKEYDLYLLDVIMPDLNGIEVGKALREKGQIGAIVYLTTSPDYAVESYQANAFFYLLKPVEREELFEVLDRAAEMIRKRSAEAVVLRIAKGVRTVPLDDILYAEREDRIIHYHLTNGEVITSRPIRGSFRDASAPLLRDCRFCLCGVSYVLNLYHVKAIEQSEAVLDCGTRVPLSRAALMEVKRAWMDYWLGGA